MTFQPNHCKTKIIKDDIEEETEEQLQAKADEKSEEYKKEKEDYYLKYETMYVYYLLWQARILTKKEKKYLDSEWAKANFDWIRFGTTVELLQKLPKV